MSSLKANSLKKKQEVSEVEALRKSLKDLSLLPSEKKEKKNIGKAFSLFAGDAVELFMKMKAAKSFRSLSNILFKKIDKLFPSFFRPMKSAVSAADINIMPESYVGLCMGIPFLVAASVFGVMVVEAAMLELPLIVELFMMSVIPVVFFLICFFVLYTYPFEKLKHKARNIDANMPFAVNHLAAIASSGVPPERAFEMLTQFKEYGSVSVEAKNIVDRINIFGEDLTQALTHVAKTTPSKPLRDLLYGIMSITVSGGNLKDYLNEVASIALFNYKLARRKYIETLSTYADIYTGILIAAPLFLVAILTVMNIIPGSFVAGFTVDQIMWLGVYVIIPILNIGFLAFVTYTQPEI